MKTDGHLAPMLSQGRLGDAANAILTAVGHNFRIVLAWLRDLLSLILVTIFSAFKSHYTFKSAS
jgi:IS5 family transposase